MVEEIFALAVELGGVAEGERAALRLLCQRAEAAMAERLKEGVGAEDCAPAFILGCAWMALADLWSTDAEDGFTAGGLTIRPGKRGDGLRTRAETVMAPYLKDRGFYFAGVQG